MPSLSARVLRRPRQGQDRPGARCRAVADRVHEPVSALDVSSGAGDQPARPAGPARACVLFIAHDLAVVKHIATTVAVMYLGRIVGSAAAEIFAEPRHPRRRCCPRCRCRRRARGGAHGAGATCRARSRRHPGVTSSLSYARRDARQAALLGRRRNASPPLLARIPPGSAIAIRAMGEGGCDVCSRRFAGEAQGRTDSRAHVADRIVSARPLRRHRTENRRLMKRTPSRTLPDFARRSHCRVQH